VGELKEKEPAHAATGASSVGDLHEIAERLSYTYIIHHSFDFVKGASIKYMPHEKR
jgi:hypothetical protein